MAKKRTTTSSNKEVEIKQEIIEKDDDFIECVGDAQEVYEEEEGSVE